MNQLTKKELRTAMKSLRMNMSEGEYRQESDSICRRLMDLSELRAARSVHIFWPHVEWREPDIRPVIQFLLNASIPVALPVIRSYDQATNKARMTHVRYAASTPLSKNRWGIHEPDGDTIVSPLEFDVIVVPALGLDRAGNRLGYGRAYYDAFLSETDALLVCPIFSRCIVDRLPIEKHDIPVHWIVSEKECLQIGKT